MTDPVEVVLKLAILAAGLVCTVVGVGLTWMAIMGLMDG